MLQGKKTSELNAHKISTPKFIQQLESGTKSTKMLIKGAKLSSPFEKYEGHY